MSNEVTNTCEKGSHLNILTQKLKTHQKEQLLRMELLLIDASAACEPKFIHYFVGK